MGHIDIQKRKAISPEPRGADAVLRLSILLDLPGNLCQRKPLPALLGYAVNQRRCRIRWPNMNIYFVRHHEFFFLIQRPII